ncbi:hypothetical protein [Xylophilus sp.]|uniref:hypothetical protein n=1 Tax=Xylophilus sp. TaxID=2653893 RepID=UPI0013BC7C5B|nr:hypothetical protein [Xylophilus sp.]KAF1047915.1 MAG: hypothetical protein GAK38_01625 [Xylophilus sp.]
MSAGEAEDAQRERFLREHLDAVTRNVGEMQAKGDAAGVAWRTPSDLAGMNPADFCRLPGQPVSGRPATVEELPATLADL